MIQLTRAATTRWIDSEHSDLDEAVAAFLEHIDDDDPTSNIYWRNWRAMKCFDQSQAINLNDREVQYNLLECHYDQVSLGDGPEENRTSHKNLFIIVYHVGNSIQYIISQNSNAKKVLRKILKYTGKMEIIENNFKFPSDFFVWLIHKIYMADSIVESSDLELMAIKSFKGNTEDFQTKVSAKGESVMNVLSTLSFLLESRQLDQLTIEIRYSEHENINLVLRSGTVTIDFAPYQGAYEEDSSDSKLAKLYLLTYLEILPILDQAYKSDKEDGTWDDSTLSKFSQNIAEDIRKRVNARLVALSRQSDASENVESETTGQ